MSNSAEVPVSSGLRSLIDVSGRVLAVRDPWHRGPRSEAFRRLVARALWEAFLRRSPRGRAYPQRLASGADVVLDVADRIQGEAALLRGYEPMLVRAIVDLLPADGVVFDVGANVGLVAVDVLALHPTATLHAFEPHPANVDALQRNLAPLEPRAHVVPVAAGAAPGQAALVTARAHEAGQHRIQGAADGAVATMSVDVTTLDAYAAEHGIDRVDVIKLDVEGFELSVLQGARSLLERGAIRAIITEAAPTAEDESAAIATLLHEHGFTATEIPSVSPAHLLARTAHLAPRDFAYVLR